MGKGYKAIGKKEIVEGTTTICVPLSIKRKLDSIKIIPREPYYGVIERLFNQYLESVENKE